MRSPSQKCEKRGKEKRKAQFLILRNTNFMSLSRESRTKEDYDQVPERLEAVQERAVSGPRKERLVKRKDMSP